MATARHRYLFHVEMIVDDQTLHGVLRQAVDRGLPEPKVRPVIAPTPELLQLKPTEAEAPPAEPRRTVTALDFVRLYAIERAGPFTVKEAVEVKPTHFTRGGITSAVSVLKREKILKHLGPATYAITAKGTKIKTPIDVVSAKSNGAAVAIETKNKRAPHGALMAAVLEDLKGGAKRRHELAELAKSVGAAPDSINSLLDRLIRDQKIARTDAGYVLKGGATANA